MKTSMFGTGTDTTDLREKEKNFLNFIVINGGVNNHPAYPFLSPRIDIVSSEEQLTNTNSCYICLKQSGIKDIHLVIFRGKDSDEIGICNLSTNKSAQVYVNGNELKYNEDTHVRKQNDFYMSVSQDDKQSCILGSVKDYSNRDWESYPLYKSLNDSHSSIVTIGRELDNNLCIDNHTVSRHHGYFQLKQGKVFFRERNENPVGNRINGNAIDKECEVPDRSILMLGAAAFIYVNGILLYSPFNNGCELALSEVTKEIKPFFKKKKVLLKDINMIVPGNSLVAIMGPSGAGKSTLIDLIRKNEYLTSGSIKLNGIEIKRSPQFQKCMGYVHQNNLLRDKLTVYDTIFYYAKIRIGDSIAEEKINIRIEDTLQRMNLSNLKNSKIAVLSGGQKKKVAIACELVCDPQVLFLDEPTSGLDPDSEAEIMRILKELTCDKKRGKTIMVITHSLLHFNEFDKVIFIGKDERDQTGYLCYYGSPAGIFSHFNVEDNNFIEIYEQAVQLPDVSAKAYKEQYLKNNERRK